MSLSKFLTRIVLFMIFLCTMVAFSIILIMQYNNYIKDLNITKEEFFEIKKQELRREIAIVNNYIDFKMKNNNNLSEEDLKNEILTWISSIRYEKDGYIFVNDFNGNALVYDGKKNNSKFTHPNFDVYLKQVELLKEKKEDFFFYEFKKLKNDDVFEKYSYIVKNDVFNWIIGTGVYIDDLNNEISEKNKKFKNDVIECIFLTLISFLSLFILFYFLINKITKYIDNNIKTLISSFQIASNENKRIETTELTYTEFVSLAESLNEILEKKNRAEKKLADYLEMVDENVILSCTNKDGIITSVSKAFCDISGYSSEELIGKSHNLVRHEDMSDELYKDLWKTLKKGFIWRGEIKNKAKNGTTYWVDAIIQPVFEEGKLTGYTALRHNITNKKTIEYISEVDELTKLYNRRKFNHIIENELHDRKRENRFICLMFLDVDYFKYYNDTYGHQSGDIALEKIAFVLKDCTKRNSDYAFRLGGEEFAVLLTIDNQDNVYEYANRIKNQIEDLKIPHIKNEISPYITISIGVVYKNSLEILNSAELYKLADDALYEAKNLGRNCVYMKN